MMVVRDEAGRHLQVAARPVRRPNDVIDVLDARGAVLWTARDRLQFRC